MLEVIPLMEKSTHTMHDISDIVIHKRIKDQQT